MTTQEFLSFGFSLAAIVLGGIVLFWLVSKIPEKINDTNMSIVKVIAQIIIVVLAAALVISLMTGSSYLTLP